MKLAFTRNDKIRLLVSVVIIIIGLLIIGYIYSPLSNGLKCPPVAQAPNCGEDPTAAGILLLLSAFIVVVGVVALVATLLLSFVARKVKRSFTALPVTVLIIGGTLWIVWYVFVGAANMKEQRHQAEITSGLRSLQTQFVNYNNAPKFSAVTRQSRSVTTKTDSAGNINYLTLDLYHCYPGAGKATYATATTYFVFSGIRKEKFGDRNDYECVFYMQPVPTNQKWDGLLHLKCVWQIDPVDGDNQNGHTVTAQGIDFRDFPLLYCIDLRTGTAPKSTS